MSDKSQKWIAQFAEYGASTTNTAHEINNALAILMGYTENLEYMIETNKLDMNELQEVCDKLFFGVEKLNQYSRHLASERKRIATEKKSEDITDYFSRWIKIVAPLFKQNNYVVTFVSGDEFFIDTDWSEVNRELCKLFSQIFDLPKREEAFKIEFYTQRTPEGLLLNFTSLDEVQWNHDLSFLGKELKFAQTEEYSGILFTCFSQEAISESAA